LPESAIGFGPTKLLVLTFRDLRRHGLIIRTADLRGDQGLQAAEEGRAERLLRVPWGSRLD
jgi:hypothetical protein